MLLEIIASIRFKKCLIQIFNVTYMRLLQVLSKTETRLSDWRVQLLHLLFLSLFKSDVIYKDQTITSMVLCLATYILIEMKCVTVTLLWEHENESLSILSWNAACFTLFAESEFSEETENPLKMSKVKLKRVKVHVQWFFFHNPCS